MRGRADGSERPWLRSIPSRTEHCRVLRLNPLTNGAALRVPNRCEHSLWPAVARPTAGHNHRRAEAACAMGTRVLTAMGYSGTHRAMGYSGTHRSRRSARSSSGAIASSAARRSPRGPAIELGKSTRQNRTNSTHSTALGGTAWQGTARHGACIHPRCTGPQVRTGVSATATL